MEILQIKGGRPLGGQTSVSGSKNSATKMMIASLLTDEECAIAGIPFSLETAITRELCERIGSKVDFTPDHRCIIRTEEIHTSRVPELSRKNRIPILALGPLLHRKGVAEVPFLGGDPIGHRPIDFHIEALTTMGIRIERREHSYYAEADAIHGADIRFPFPSVGATENVILTAVLAHGKTTISNAAVEPEIINTITMLKEMGADIECDAPLRTITIEGVERLSGASVRVMPDRNEIVSFAVSALATGGDIFIRGIEESYLVSFLEALRGIGASYEPSPEGIRFYGKKPYRPIRIETAPHPGFMTDWQQPFCVLLTQADGTSILHETVYEDRLGYLKDLQRMGAEIEVSDECTGFTPCRLANRTFNHRAEMRGPSSLHGAQIEVRDIRAGMSHVLAALAAEGESIISGVAHIDRGYERIDERLKALGADIRRIEA